MRKLRALWIRLRAMIGSHRSDEDFASELESHIAMHVEDGINAGLSPEEARRQALIALGGVEQTRQAYRERRTLPWLENLARDVRYALRGFRRNPVFTFTVIVTLALGIGATTAVFSVVDRILFRSLPYAHGDQIVSLGLVQSLEKQEFMLGGFFYDWRDNQKPFEAIASQGTMLHACDLVEANPAQLNCIHAQAGFLPLLGISPALGRNFLPEEDRPNGPSVALISYGLWQDHYNRDPDILNRQIDVDGSPVRVIGVLPKGFELPTLQAPDVMLPMALNEGAERIGHPGTPMRAFARLRPGVSIEQARAEMEPLFLHTQAWIPQEIRRDFHLSIRSLRDRETQDVRFTAWILLGSVLAVLLIACANVAGLMVARSEARERELALRSALGASRGGLMRQTLTEAALLSLAGAAVGLMLAEGLLRIFLAIAPSGIPFLTRAGLDLRIAVFTVMLSLACAMLFGFLPALQKPRSIALAARVTHARKRALLRRGLVVGQIAIGMVLLTSAALLLRSFENLEQQNLGIETQGVLTARIALPEFHYNTAGKRMAFYLQAEAALRRLPGIRAVSFSDSVPPGGWNNDERIEGFAPEGRRPAPSSGSGSIVVVRRVTPDYFRALNLPIILGRGFTEQDRGTSENLVVLSRLLAARLFPGEDPVGKSIQKGESGIWLKVAGVAENAKNNGLTEQNAPEVYFLRRNTTGDWGPPAPVMIVDAILSPKTVAPWVRSQIAGIDPTVPVGIETLNQSVSKLADRPRFETALLGFFASCGLLMAVIGLYGVVSFMTVQRNQEIGVRMALGATRLDILLLIAGEGARLIIFGILLGLGAALAAAQLLKSLLFNVGPHDPASFVAVTLLLALVALAASWLPARRAASIDPMRSLRTE
jgi:putative ABC transport system permease protein